MTLNNFLGDFSKIFDSEIKQKAGKVFQVTGQTNCLFYFKERKSGHQNWGITKNVIDRLREENFPWFLLLLSSPPYANYFLTSDNVEHYIKNKWTLNKDGDYKTATTFPGENEFSSVEQLKSKIEK
jgi:hypothetical protein